MPKNDYVDYLNLIARVTEEDRAKQAGETLLPEPAGEQAVDYLAVSQQWKEIKGLIMNRK